MVNNAAIEVRDLHVVRGGVDAPHHDHRDGHLGLDDPVESMLSVVEDAV